MDSPTQQRPFINQTILTAILSVYKTRSSTLQKNSGACAAQDERDDRRVEVLRKASRVAPLEFV